MSFDKKHVSGASGVCERELIISHPPLFLSPFKQISKTFKHLKNIKHKLYEINQNFESKHQTFCSWQKCQEQ